MQGLKLGATVAALLAVSAPAWAESTVLRNVTVIDGTGAAPAPNSAIVMTDGKIAYVGPVSGLKVPQGAKVVDLAGKFVMPGIIDSHVHVGMMHDVTQDEKYETPENVAADLKTYAAYGVTAVQVLAPTGLCPRRRNKQRRAARPWRGSSAPARRRHERWLWRLVGVTNLTYAGGGASSPTSSGQGRDLPLLMDDERKTIRSR